MLKQVLMVSSSYSKENKKKIIIKNNKRENKKGNNKICKIKKKLNLYKKNEENSFKTQSKRRKSISSISKI
jgi:hypothetical protein